MQELRKYNLKKSKIDLVIRIKYRQQAIIMGNRPNKSPDHRRYQP